MAIKKLRKYEMIYLVQPEATEEDRDKVATRFDAVVEQFNGVFLEREDWGKRKLSYEIRKQNKAYYYYCVLLGPTGMTQEIERVLRMLDNCIRFMTIKLEEGITPDRAQQLEDESKAGKASQAAAGAAEEQADAQ